MLKFVSVAEMQAIEGEADSGGLSYAEMMQNAGRGLAEVIHEIYFQEGCTVLALVGSGNNGGDALVALRFLAGWGWKVGACLIRNRDGDDPLMKQVVDAGGEVFSLTDDPEYMRLDTAIGNADVLLDGVLGTGIRLPLKDDLAAIFKHVQDVLAEQDEPAWIAAVDCPSGLDCDSGAVAEQTLRAQTTVTMAAIKKGMLNLPAFEYLGDLRLVSIGSLEGIAAWEAVQQFVVEGDWVREALPERPLDAHKGTFGTALVVAGSRSYTGAAMLAGKAAYRIGAGLVTLGVPESLHAVLAGHFPEATWALLPEESGCIASQAAEIVTEQLDRVTALLLGPGFGLEKNTLAFLDRLLSDKRHSRKSNIGFLAANSQEGDDQQALPATVVDADGLKLLAQLPDWAERLPAPAVLTPHPGEMAVLTGLSKDELQKDRISTAIQFAKKWGHVVVLKGAFTVIAAPDGRCAIIPVATPALARAGTGDVLAGIITGLVAQGTQPFEAAAAGSWIHAQAGLRAEEYLGSSAAVLAGDVLNSIAEVLQELQLTG